ncbi:protein SRG1 [Ricinus communis]|uniref:protein SRG1 n=1 Tax=Ricinus communis TaxID=3988 RepID=UPI00201ADFA2|nr:protein SRG1 [Ricinus communis]
METKSILGTSLLVPSVKDLISNKEQLTSAIPSKYVRHDQDPVSVLDKNSLPDVPVIDMAKLFSEKFMDLELKKFDHACKDWGFFQLVNHGVSTELLEKVKSKTQEFFNLPKEEKQKFCQKPGEMEGFGQHFVKSEEQKLEWADLFYVVTQPTHLRNPHLFSNIPQSFRDAIETYSEELKSLAHKIFDLVAKAVGMKPDEMKELFEEGWQAMRMNCYPPCPQPDLVIGLKPHSDATGLTILLQVNDVVGLQIKKDGFWIPVQPIPNAFIINIGDMLEILTNGIYRSIEHRATISSAKERLSIATFYNPKFDGYLAPAPSLITAKTPAAFERISFADYFQGYVSRELDGKSFIQVLRIQNNEIN